MRALGYRRAPANGAPDRYAAVLDLEVAKPDSGGSTPLATALALGRFDRHGIFQSVTFEPKSVTRVLNLKCYLCIDCALGFPLSFVFCHLSFSQWPAVGWLPPFFARLPPELPLIFAHLTLA